VDSRQRQRVADIICEEWFDSDPLPSYLDSATILARLEAESEDVDNVELVDLLDDLEGVYTTHTRFMNGRRIVDVDASLCDAAFN
jgi:hypothetical protein